MPLTKRWTRIDRLAKLVKRSRRHSSSASNAAEISGVNAVPSTTTEPLILSDITIPAISAHELKRIDTGDSVVDEYARQPWEFFPCAVEAFFQKPIALKEKHRRLYGFFARYFRQRPATWESKLRARTSPASSV
jgi:Mlc titration factor MtfA (ptsG expression regulator)